MPPSTWVIVGASRGIGLEFVKQILARGDHVIATVRDPSQASDLWSILNSAPPGACRMVLCDVASEEKIEAFTAELLTFHSLPRIDYLLLNAGILHYPNRALDMSFGTFAEHLQTNCIGPIVTAQRLLASRRGIGSVVFMSSDSGSAGRFLDYEDGFAAYAASKAALNQALRHMAAELRRERRETVVLALHPGEVSTDMQNIDIEWEVDGLLTPEESIRGMMKVITSKGLEDSGTFWTWEGEKYPW